MPAVEVCERTQLVEPETQSTYTPAPNSLDVPSLSPNAMYVLYWRAGPRGETVVVQSFRVDDMANPILALVRSVEPSVSYAFYVDDTGAIWTRRKHGRAFALFRNDERITIITTPSDDWSGFRPVAMGLFRGPDLRFYRWCAETRRLLVAETPAWWRPSIFYFPAPSGFLVCSWEDDDGKGGSRPCYTRISSHGVFKTRTLRLTGKRATDTRRAWNVGDTWWTETDGVCMMCSPTPAEREKEGTLACRGKVLHAPTYDKFFPLSRTCVRLYANERWSTLSTLASYGSDP